MPDMTTLRVFRIFLLVHIAVQTILMGITILSWDSRRVCYTQQVMTMCISEIVQVRLVEPATGMFL